MSAKKLKVAIALGSSCAGCDVAIVDLGEKLLEVFNKVDIVYWPTAFDYKLEDLKALEDGSIDYALFDGAIGTSEDREIAELLREKSKNLVAFGACACFGGLIGLANLTVARELLETVYVRTISTDNPNKVIPQPKSDVNGLTLTLPEKLDTLLPLSDVVEVDYFVPGCPPESELVEKLFTGILTGEMPPKGYTFAEEHTLCEDCPRVKSETRKILEVKRRHLTKVDPEKCFLDQGILCMGPATRAGCGAKCIKANMPCRGCMGPTANVRDQGAKFLSAIASILGEDTASEEELAKIVDQIVDPVGSFYRFTLPSSILKRKVVREGA